MTDNLIQNLSIIFNENGIDPNPMLNYPSIAQVIEADPESQRIALNRYWNLQLMTLPVDTISERYCLVPNGQYADWLRLFQAKILPRCIEFRLPRAI